MLVKYDIHTIYQIYLLHQPKIICIKDLKIVENAEEKKS